MTDTRQAMLDLPFVDGNEESGISLWRAGLTDGRALADAALAFIRAHEAPSFLFQIQKAMAAVGHYGAAEISFWQRVAEHALA